jgi:hypothetical protein
VGGYFEVEFRQRTSASRGAFSTQEKLSTGLREKLSIWKINRKKQ